MTRLASVISVPSGVLCPRTRTSKPPSPASSMPSTRHWSAPARRSSGRGKSSGLFSGTHSTIWMVGIGGWEAIDVRNGTSRASSERGWGNPVLRIPNVVGDRLSLDWTLPSPDVARLRRVWISLGLLTRRGLRPPSGNHVRGSPRTVEDDRSCARPVTSRRASRPLGRQRCPLPFVRILITDLHAPSVTPLPTGKPTAEPRVAHQVRHVEVRSGAG